jgi:carboxypeptidase C (cathepsin A)
MMNKMMLFALLALVSADMDGPFNYNGYKGYSGEILLTPVTGSSMFYWMFTSVGGDISHDNRPLIIWTAGGPGYASEIGLFVEGLAPFTIDENGNTVNNPATLAHRCHILAIDFPYGTGFSYASQPTDFHNTTVSALPYLYQFLQKLIKKYPSWFQRDVFWFGEDYSGHFVPAIANYILEENQISSNIPIILKGIALGNPWGDGLYQTPFYDQFAFQLGLINSQQAQQLQQGESQIQQLISIGNYTDAFNTWLYYFGQFEGYTGNVSAYDMRYYGTPSFPALSNFLNQASTKKTFNVPPGAKWQQFNSEIYYSFEYDFMQGIATHLMPTLLQNMKVMIYHGQDDLYCNIMGLGYWVKNWDWELSSNYHASRRGSWKVKGDIAGYVQTYSNFTFVNVMDAGNWVGWGQPYVFRDLAYRFIFNQGWN